MKNLLTILILSFFLFSCSTQNKITVAYVGSGYIEKGTHVYREGNVTQAIGLVDSYKPNKNIDTVFLTIKIHKGVKIPKGSSFDIYENSFGPSNIQVKCSNNTAYLKVSDIATGTFISALSRITVKDSTIKQ